MKLKFDPSKNAKLIAERGISFDQISDIMTSDGAFVIKEHHNKEKYPHQKIIYVPIDDEVYAIPCIEQSENCYFLKTIFPSRVARKALLKNKKPRI